MKKSEIRQIIREELEEAEKKGLWANIHAKRKRGEAPAKPGDEDYPDEESWDAAQESVSLREIANDMNFTLNPMVMLSETKVSDSLKYHLDKNTSLTENVYRYGSEKFFNLINEVRDLYQRGVIDLDAIDEELVKSDIGTKGVYEGQEVWLDIPMLSEAEYQGKKVELSKPKRGGSKKFYVYVKDGDKVKKVSFGADSGGGKLAVKLKDPEARKAFASRHNCETKNDKTKAGYWSCRLPRYAKSLGLSGGGQWW
jgi:hypothetical protein